MSEQKNIETLEKKTAGLSLQEPSTTTTPEKVATIADKKEVVTESEKTEGSIEDKPVSPSKSNTSEPEEKSIFDSKEEFTVKHPLNTKWTLWYTKPQVDKSESWADLLKPVIAFTTVEEFWAIYNNIPKVNDLPLKADYHLFREDVRPEWEDSVNAKGGKWAFQFKDKRRINIDEIWLRAMLGAIGETIEENENEITGVVINVRKSHFRVSLWTRSTNRDRLAPIGKKFKKVLSLSDNEKLDFYSHTESEKAPRTNASFCV